jgi:hypothetical protein
MRLQFSEKIEKNCNRFKTIYVEGVLAMAQEFISATKVHKTRQGTTKKKSSTLLRNFLSSKFKSFY